MSNTNLSIQQQWTQEMYTDQILDCVKSDKCNKTNIGKIMDKAHSISSRHGNTQKSMLMEKVCRIMRLELEKPVKERLSIIEISYKLQNDELESTGMIFC